MCPRACVQQPVCTASSLVRPETADKAEVRANRSNSSTRITCEAPPSSTKGPATLKVSIDNGFHYIGALDVTYHTTPTLFGLEPVGASIIGGRPLKVKGRGFAYLQLMGAPLPTCDFGFDTVEAVVEDDSTLICEAPPVTSAHTHVVDVRLGRKRYVLPKSTNLTLRRFDAVRVQKVDPPRGSAAGASSISSVMPSRKWHQRGAGPSDGRK